MRRVEDTPVKQETSAAKNGALPQMRGESRGALPAWGQLMSLGWFRPILILTLAGLWVCLAALPVANG
jgi:hypothetical protein